MPRPVTVSLAPRAVALAVLEVTFRADLSAVRVCRDAVELHAIGRERRPALKTRDRDSLTPDRDIDVRYPNLALRSRESVAGPVARRSTVACPTTPTSGTNTPSMRRSIAPLTIRLRSGTSSGNRTEPVTSSWLPEPVQLHDTTSRRRLARRSRVGDACRIGTRAISSSARSSVTSPLTPARSRLLASIVATRSTCPAIASTVARSTNGARASCVIEVSRRVLAAGPEASGSEATKAGRSTPRRRRSESEPFPRSRRPAIGRRSASHPAARRCTWRPRRYRSQAADLSSSASRPTA